MPQFRPQGVSSGITDQLYSGKREAMPNDPMDVEDAIRQRVECTAEVSKLDSLLANKNVTDENGKRVCDRAYQMQRGKLVQRKMLLTSRLSYLKAWIRENQNGRETDSLVDVSNWENQVFTELAKIKDSVRMIGTILEAARRHRNTEQK